MGRLAKTDRVDARVLAEWASTLFRRRALKSSLRPPPDELQQQLAALVTRRRQLVAMLHAERQRLRLDLDLVRPSLEAIIELLRKPLDEIHTQMIGRVNRHCAGLDQLLQSAGGIGPTAGGRFELRRALYMATLTSTRYNPAIRVFHESLLAAGKLKKIALIACMGKLLTILNAMARDSIAFDPTRTALD